MSDPKQDLDETNLDQADQDKNQQFPQLVSATPYTPTSDQFAPPVSSTQLTQQSIDAYPATVAQKSIATFHPDFDISTVWSPDESILDGHASRAKTQGTDAVSKYDEAIRNAEFTSKEKVWAYCARLFEAHQTQQKQSQKGSDDVMKLLLAIGTVTEQVGILGQAVHKNTADIDAIRDDIRNLGDFAQGIKAKVTELIEHINVVTPANEALHVKVRNVVNSTTGVWERTDAISKRVTVVDTKLMAASTSNQTMARELERLKADMFRTTNEVRLSTQRLEEKLRTTQSDIEHVHARVGDEVEAAVQRQGSRPQSVASTSLETASVSSGQLSPTHRRASYMCSMCNVLFTTSREFHTHNNKMHKDPAAAPYACQNCNRRFANQRGLTNHIVSKHNIPATTMPTAEATRDVHHSYLIPCICIPNITVGDVEAEEFKQVLARIQEVRADIQKLHIKHTKRLTEDGMIPPGVPYTVLVTFHDSATRTILHEANAAKGWPLKPFLDSTQIEEAKKQVSLGRLAFLGTGSASGMPAAAGASTIQGQAASHAQLPRPLPNQGATRPPWARPTVPQPVGSAETTTPSMQLPPPSTTTSNFTPIQAIQPFPREPQSEALPTRRGRGKGAEGRGRGQRY